MCQKHPTLADYNMIAGAAEDIRRDDDKSRLTHEAKKCDECRFFHAFPKKRAA